MIVLRAVFLSNMFSGSRTFSSFQLARGYQPSVLGIPSTVVSQELLEEHMEQMATRALQQVLKSHDPHAPRANMFSPGDIFWVWYAITKNEPNEWVKARVVKPHTHYLERRRIHDGVVTKGRNMWPAYEDVRAAHNLPLRKN